MRNSLRTNTNGSAAGEQRSRGNKHLAVPGHIFTLVLLTINGKTIKRADKVTKYRHAKQRRLRQERNPAGCQAEKKRRINQGIRMIENEDDRALSRYVLQTHHFDAPKIDAHRESKNGNNEPASHQGGYCTRFWLVMVQMFDRSGEPGGNHLRLESGLVRRRGLGHKCPL